MLVSRGSGTPTGCAGQPHRSSSTPDLCGPAFAPSRNLCFFLDSECAFGVFWIPVRSGSKFGMCVSHFFFWMHFGRASVTIESSWMFKVDVSSELLNQAVCTRKCAISPDLGPQKIALSPPPRPPAPPSRPPPPPLSPLLLARPLRIHAHT